MAEFAEGDVGDLANPLRFILKFIDDDGGEDQLKAPDFKCLKNSPFGASIP